MKLLKKNLTVSLSILTLLLFTGCAGAMSSLKEGALAAMEKPSVEKQLDRASLGINMIKTNQDILYNMPISEDAKWVDEILESPSAQREKEIQTQVKNDPYTASYYLSGISQSPIMIDFFRRLNALYEIDKMLYSDLYEAPKSMNEYVEYKHFKLKKVEALNGKLFNNVEEAVIALTPDDTQEGLKSAKDEYKNAIEQVLVLKDAIGNIESYLSDDKNEKANDLEDKKAELSIKEKELEDADEIADEKEKIYFESLKLAAEAIQSNFDESKLPLAKKISKLLDVVNAGTLQAGTLFTIALLKTPGALSQISDELASLNVLKAGAAMQGGDKVVKSVDLRTQRITSNGIYLLPNLGVGAYYTMKQTSLAKKYQDVVGAYLDAAQAIEKAEKK
jgi:hypothetical protein